MSATTGEMDTTEEFLIKHKNKQATEMGDFINDLGFIHDGRRVKGSDCLTLV